MNVAEVITELQKYPAHLPVRAFMSTVTCQLKSGVEVDIRPDSSEAQEVTAIQWRGHDICLDCDGLAA